MENKNSNLEDFKRKLKSIFQFAKKNAQPYIDINSGNLHRQVGGYPKHSHRMRSCCSVMRQYMKPGDEILDEPRRGQGASLTIRYFLPR